MELTIDLPDPVFRQLRAIADLTKQPLNELILQSIAGNLPPSINNVSVKMQTELLQMQTFSIEALREVARAHVSSEQQEEHLILLDKNKSESLTESERSRLQELRTSADQLMLKKAYACSVLRWRGQPIRSINGYRPPSFMPSISRSVRQKVAARASYCCEYCKTQERLIAMPLVIDHVFPTSSVARIH